MSSTGRTLSMTLPVTGVSHCSGDAEWVCCLGCEHPLGLVQPESEDPSRLIGTCDECGRWYLLDWHPGAREGVMLLLPDHGVLLRTYAGKTA